jgi:hypothetical protein
MDMTVAPAAMPPERSPGRTRRPSPIAGKKYASAEGCRKPPPRRSAEVMAAKPCCSSAESSRPAVVRRKEVKRRRSERAIPHFIAPVSPVKFKFKGGSQ